MSDKYIGDYKKGQLVRVKFNTFSKAIIPTAPTVDPTVAVYKDSATEITVTGITQPTVNFDSKDGVHELVIDTSDAVYEIGKDYDIIFTAGTVDGTDLTRTILRTFSIENRNTDANVIRIAGQTANAAGAVTFPASVANETTVSNRPTLVQIEESTILAKELTVASRATQSSVNAIPTNPLRDNDARVNFLDASIATSTSSVLGAISGLNNLSAKANLFGAAVLEAPETGSSIYEFTLVVNDDEGKLVNLDTAPTITATNSSGTNRSTNLSAVTNPAVGRYRFTYTTSSTHPREGLRIEANGTTSTESRYAIWAGAVVDFDQSTVLAQIVSDLALKPTLVQIDSGTMASNVTALTQRLTEARAGYLDGVLLAQNFNHRVVHVTGSHNVSADLRESQPNSIHPTTLQTTVYNTLSANLLATSHSSYITPGTVGKTLTDTNTSLSTLLTRIPAATAQLVADLALMLVGSGTALVRWTVNALSLAPSGGAGGTIIATVAVPSVLQNTAYALDEILVYRGTYWSFQIQNLGDLTSYNQIWFCLRKRQNDDESQSDLLIALNGGLLVANKKTNSIPTLASLTVTGSTVTIQVDESITQFIDTGNNYNYDLKGRNVAGHTIMLHESDKFVVKRDVTRRIV
jgi:hypothetical protein